MSATALFCRGTCADPAGPPNRRYIVNERRAAFANQLPGVRSTGRWREAVHTDRKDWLLIATTDACLAWLGRRLLALHPHEVPELIRCRWNEAMQPTLTVRQQSRG